MTELPRQVAVLGGGTMGAGIAAAHVLASVPTTVVVRRSEAVEETRASVAARLEAHVALGLADARTAAAAERLLDVRLDLGGGPYDAIVESIAEDATAKRELLARVETALAEDGVLATNTSSLCVDDLARALAEPGRFLGWHWFNPADLVRLVEIVPGKRTRPEAAERVLAWSLALGKAPLRLRRDVPGFVANRLQYALLREAYALLAAGACGPEDVDLAVTAGLGARWSAIGPFTSVDLAGLDVHEAVAASLFPELDRSTGVPALLAELRRGGAAGVKNGRGLCGAYPAAAVEALVGRRDSALAAASRAQPDGGRDLSPEECAERARQAAGLVDLSALDRSGPGEAQLLWREPRSEAWLNLWWQPRDTGYHDHDGSAVGVHVIEGRAWHEPLVIGGPRRVREYGPGESFGFSGHGIHRMDHEPGAITVHVYSPPLRAIGHYELDDGELRRRPTPPDAPSPPSPALFGQLDAPTA